MISARVLASIALVAVCVGGCASVQELGNDAPSPQAAPSGLAVTAPVPQGDLAGNQADPVWQACPAAVPDDRAGCAMQVRWCAYPRGDGSGLTAMCSCGADKQWTCVAVRDTHRKNAVPLRDLSFTSAACTEGAPCAQGVRCAVDTQRSCMCASSGRLLCSRAAQ